MQQQQGAPQGAGAAMFAAGAMAAMPQQVGPPTPEMIRHKRTLLGFVILQGFMGIIGLAWLADLLNFVFACAQVFVGYQAYDKDMHISYISLWGVISLVNGVLQTVGEVLPILMGVLSMKLSEAFVRCMMPVASLLGAAFAWHIYVDYANQEHINDFGLHNAFRDPWAMAGAKAGEKAYNVTHPGFLGGGGGAAKKDANNYNAGLPAAGANPMATNYGAPNAGATAYGAPPQGPEQGTQFAPTNPQATIGPS